MKGETIVAAQCQGIRGSAMEELYQCRGQKVSVKDYFYDELETNLKYPSLPCICLNISEEKNLVPIEVSSLSSIALNFSY